jgi:hypothetical protein
LHQLFYTGEEVVRKPKSSHTGNVALDRKGERLFLAMHQRPNCCPIAYTAVGPAGRDLCSGAVRPIWRLPDELGPPVASFTFAQLRFSPSPPRPLPEQRTDGHRLHQDHKNACQDVLPINCPKVRRSIQHHAARRQCRLRNVPSAERPPIHADLKVRVVRDWNVIGSARVLLHPPSAISVSRRLGTLHQYTHGLNRAMPKRNRLAGAARPHQ